MGEFLMRKQNPQNSNSGILVQLVQVIIVKTERLEPLHWQMSRAFQRVEEEQKLIVVS